MKRSFLLLLMLLSTVFTSQSHAAKSALKENISEHFYTTLVSENEESYTVFFAPPTNDGCGGALAVPVSPERDCIYQTTVDLNGATASGNSIASSCDATIGSPAAAADVWFKFKATGSKQTFTISNFVASTPSQPVRMIIYNTKSTTTSDTYGCVTPDNKPFGANGSVFDCSKSITGNTSFSLQNFKNGEDYYIRFYTKGASTSTLDLCISTPFGPLYVSPVREIYTATELIKDVFVKSTGCDLVSNVTTKNGAGLAQHQNLQTLGYFSKNGADFPFDEGIVLSTTEVKYTPGPYQGYTVANRGAFAPRWFGDQDLKDAINSGGTNPDEFRSTEVEFNFRPVKDKISFEYLFASNSFHRDCGEMNLCKNGAMFAAWLIDPNGNGQNLALVPGTTDAISINTVRDMAKIGHNCTNENIEYYDRYYADIVRNPTDVPADSAIDYVGTTKAMQSAEVSVIPGKVYRIKLAVMDFCGTPSHNSAVFFNAGSFDIGNPSLGEDLTIEAGNAPCPGSTITIGTDIDTDYYDVAWFKNGSAKPIFGETEGTLVVSTPGNYTAELTYKDLDCTSTLGPVVIEFLPEVSIEHSPVDLDVCRSTDATTDVNLMQAVSGVSHANVEYTFFETEEDANKGINEAPYIDSNYGMNSTQSAKKIWVRIEDMDTGCYTVRSFTIRLITCDVVVASLPDIHQCKVEGKTDYTFDLSIYDSKAGYGMPGLSVTYHTSSGDANAGGNPIPTPAAFVIQQNTTIYARVTDAATNKHRITDFKLILDELPIGNPNLTPYVVCKDANETTGVFNLSSKDSEITSGKIGFTISYYETENNAKNDVDSVNRTSYDSAAKTIFYRIQAQKTGCFTTGSLVLDFNDNIVINGLTNFYTCSINGFGTFNLFNIYATVVNGNSNVASHSFYRTMADAQAGKNRVGDTSAYQNIMPRQDFLYLKLESAAGCSTIVQVVLNVSVKPDLTDPTPIELCERPQGGYDTVNLTLKEGEILAGLFTGNLTIKYYGTYNNALDGIPAGEILDPSNYSINTAGTDVYVRVENISNGECYSIVELDIKTNKLPTYIEATDYEVCDDISNDGFASFNLSTKRPEINPDGFATIEFYATKADAEAGVNLLDDSNYTNTTAYLQTVWFKVTKTNSTCSSIDSFNLKVNESPKFDLTKGGTVYTCSSDLNGGGTFNLSVGTNPGIDNITKFKVNFYDSETKAELAVDGTEIRNRTYYELTGVTQPIVYLRLESLATGCYSVYPINLVVNRMPLLPDHSIDFELCDNLGSSTDYLSIIDLTVNETDILSGVANGNPGKVTYYTTEANAVAGVNPIADAKHYRNRFETETIYYTIEDNVTGCITVGNFKFVVKSGLRLIQPEQIVLCSDLSLGQNKAYFDLTVNNNVIIDNIIDPGFLFTYYTSEADARAQLNAIPQNQVKKYMNTSPIQAIWITVTNELGCNSIISQTIVADAMPEPNMNPTALKSCIIDDTGNGSFDLRQADFNIGRGTDGLGYFYYPSLADLEADTNELGIEVDADDKRLEILVETKTATIFAKVINTKSIADPRCYVVVKIDLNVIPSPIIKDGLHFTFCLPEADLADNMVFDLRSKDAEVLEGRDENKFKVSYYKTLDDAQQYKNQLPAIYTNETAVRQIIFVRLDDKETGCFGVGEMVLNIEKSVSAIKPAEGIIMCGTSGATTETAIFDLREKAQEIVGDQGQLAVSFYASMEDYLAGKRIANMDKYQNISNPQEIFVLVSNDLGQGVESYCTAMTSFMIEVQSVPGKPTIIANGSDKEAFVCFNQDEQGVMPILIDTGLSLDEFDFRWFKDNRTFGAPNASYISVNESGNYSVDIKYKNGKKDCYSTTSNIIKVTVSKELTIKIAGQDQSGLIGSFDENDGATNIHIEEPTNVYDANGALVVGYEFALNDGIYQDGRSFYNVTNGTHRIWVRESTGAGRACPQYKDFFVLGYPKFFTPNGDGYNDTWNIPALKGHPEAVIYIFDRYGKLLKQISPRDAGWDGTFNGKMMPSSDYWFTVEYQADGLPSYKVNYKGHFSLKR